MEETNQLHGLEGKKDVTVCSIDADHLSPYNLFLENGYTKNLTPEQLAILKAEGELKPAQQLTTDDELKLSIPNNSFILLKFYIYEYENRYSSPEHPRADFIRTHFIA